MEPITRRPGIPPLSSSLDDPLRRRLYEFVTRSLRPVGRDEAAPPP